MSSENPVLKCKDCCNSLSVFPIYCTSNADFTCGRCSFNAPNAQRQFAYEEAVKSKPFPCRYEALGCSVNLPPEQLQTHENNCMYTVIACDQAACKWSDCIQKLEKHYVEKHKDFIKKHDTFFKVDIPGSLLVIGPDNVFLVRFQKDGTINMRLNNLIIAAETQFYYKVHVSVGNGGTLVHTNKHVNNSWRSEEALNWHIDVNKITCKIEILKGDNLTNQLSPSNALILKQYECPICLEYMSTQIYQCANGHVICCNCRTKLTTCPQCRVTIGNLRNLALENIARDVLLPCPNTGCSIISPLPEQKNHANQCQHLPYACFFPSCTYSGGYSALIKHLTEKHTPNVHTNKFTASNIIAGTRQHIVIIKNNYIYILSYVYDTTLFQLRTSFFAPRNVNNTFSLQVYMKSSNNESFRFKSKCLNADANLFQNKGVYNLMLPSLLVKRRKTWTMEVEIVDDSQNVSSV